VGNLHSVKKALELNGAKVDVVTEMKDLLDAECIIFPGVGAFDMTMRKLLPYREEIAEHLRSGIPALGICIGLQIMFDSSEEGKSGGLSIFDGRIKKLSAERVPHMGWNGVVSSDELMEGIEDRMFYFAHSYHCSAVKTENIIGTTEYEGETFSSFFRTRNVYGTQFHPEKSSVSGLRFMKNFISFAEDVS
jgi:imidazole glycerol phosphate synthase, glutamine amidotransferase subunit